MTWLVAAALVLAFVAWIVWPVVWAFVDATRVAARYHGGYRQLHAYLRSKRGGAS